MVSFHVQTGAAQAMKRKMKMHALSHFFVENMLASGHKPARAALRQLMAQGLTRHEAVHRIGETRWRVMMKQPLQMDGPVFNRQLNAALRQLAASGANQLLPTDRRWQPK